MQGENILFLFPPRPHYRRHLTSFPSPREREGREGERGKEEGVFKLNYEIIDDGNCELSRYNNNNKYRHAVHANSVIFFLISMGNNNLGSNYYV